jgi:6-phosphogluconolactonase
METEVLPTTQDVAARAREIILAAARSAIEQRGAFSLVLAGGSTPADCYTLLAAAQADWPRWHIYFGDERCLDPTDPERNSVMAATRLTAQVLIPAHQVHPIPAERGPEAAAQAYRDTISQKLPFDLVLLGMGEDGHTASLFPGHDHPRDALVVPVYGAPKPPAERVSLGQQALADCRQLLLMVTGAGKRSAMQRWQAGDDLPVARVAGAANTMLLLDADARP